MLRRLCPELKALDDNQLNELNEQLSKRKIDSKLRWVLESPTKKEIAFRKTLPPMPMPMPAIEDAPLDLGFEDQMPGDELAAVNVTSEEPSTLEMASAVTPEPDFTSMDDKALRDELRQMTERGDPATWYFGPARSRYLSINYELNRRCSWAPAFRGLVRPGQNRGLSLNEKACSIDRQLIDLDWLQCREVRANVDSEDYESLLNQGTLDRTLAEKFAEEAWTFEHKAAVLRLRPEVYGQLCSLVPGDKKEVFQEWESGFLPDRKRGKGRNFYEGELRNNTRPNLIKDNLPKWLDLILVCKLLGEKNASAKVVELYSLARGEKPHRTTVAASVEKIRVFL